MVLLSERKNVLPGQNLPGHSKVFLIIVYFCLFISINQNSIPLSRPAPIPAKNVTKTVNKVSIIHLPPKSVKIKTTSSAILKPLVRWFYKFISFLRDM